MKLKTRKPIALITEKSIINFYPSLASTANDGYDPEAVYRVCIGEQKTHKGKRFRFARESEYEICAQLAWIEEIRKRNGGEKQ